MNGYDYTSKYESKANRHKQNVSSDLWGLTNWKGVGLTISIKYKKNNNKIK